MSKWRIDQKDSVGPISLINDVSGDVLTPYSEREFELIQNPDAHCNNLYTLEDLSQLRSLIGELLNAHHARVLGKSMRCKQPGYNMPGGPGGPG